MKKYVVTGGAGFIGSALVRGLLTLGEGSVEVIDNLSTGRTQNLTDVASQISFREADIRSFDAIRPVIAGADSQQHAGWDRFLAKPYAVGANAGPPFALAGLGRSRHALRTIS